MPSKKTWTDTEKTTQASSKTTPAKKTSTSTTKTTATKTATTNKTTTAKASPVKKATTSPATKAPARKASTTTKKPASTGKTATNTKATTTSTAKKTTTTATKATTSKAASPTKKTPVKATAPKKTTTSSKVATKEVEKEEINEDYIPCCMEFDTVKYDNKTHRWKNKKFVKDSVFAFFTKPFGVDKKVAEMKTKIEEWRWITRTRPENVLVLFNAANSFKWEIYISIDNYVDWMNYVELSWVYFSKVYDASFDTANKLMEDMEEYLKKKGKDAHNYYIHYAYCPDCAKHYGNNYTVLFAEIE